MDVRRSARANHVVYLSLRRTSPVVSMRGPLQWPLLRPSTSPSCTLPANCSRAGIATAWPMKASKNPCTNAVPAGRRRSGCNERRSQGWRFYLRAALRNGSPDEICEAVVVRSGQEPVVINLDVETPEPASAGHPGMPFHPGG